MLFKKYILIFTLILSGSSAIAKNWSYPEPYTEPYGLLPNKSFYLITETEDAVDFLISFGDDDPYWSTRCTKGLKKGIPTTNCLVQPLKTSNTQDNNLVISFVDSAQPKVIFLPFKIVEVNYKLDSNPIIQLNKYYLFDFKTQQRLLNTVMQAKKLTYSYKVNENSKYVTVHSSLLGLKENLDFAKKFISVNQ